MSGETVMYRLKPVITLPRISCSSKIMYEMKNIHDEGPSDDKHMDPEIKNTPKITEQKPLPEVTVLQTRQEKILAELAELKKQVSVLCDFLKQFHDTKPEKIVKLLSNEVPIAIDLVINVNPKQPPYSLLALQKVWNDTDIRIQTYMHSSIVATEPSFSQKNTSSKSNVTVNLSLIWKEVDDLEIITGLHNYPLKGEVNLLRYLSRLIPKHNYETLYDSTKTNVANQILDWCNSLIYLESTSKEKLEILSLIDDKLSKQKFNDKEYSSIVNIALWSVVKQIKMKKVPENINKMFQSCEKYFATIN